MFFRLGLSFFCFCLLGEEVIYLKTPEISEKKIVGIAVGIRPYRKTGVRLEPMYLQNKLIVHNYGYGGSGLTLCFGGSKKVLEILHEEKISSKVVAILGAGVIGLTCAYDLLEKGYEVHIYADKWNPHLTSNIAAGIWTPSYFPLDILEEKKHLHERMLEIAKCRFLRSTTEASEFAGVRILPYYRVITDNTYIKKSNTEQEVTLHFDNGVIKKAIRTYRLAIDGNLFMQDLYNKTKRKGAVLYQKHFKCIEDVLNLKEPTIINCMSMGSREVFEDPEFIPIRGHLIYFTNEDNIDYSLSTDVSNPEYFVSIYPWSDRLILGGVYEVNKEELSVIPSVINIIIKNAQECFSREIE